MLTKLLWYVQGICCCRDPEQVTVLPASLHYSYIKRTDAHYITFVFGPGVMYSWEIIVTRCRNCSLTVKDQSSRQDIVYMQTAGLTVRSDCLTLILNSNSALERTMAGNSICLLFVPLGVHVAGNMQAGPVAPAIG